MVQTIEYPLVNGVIVAVELLFADSRWAKVPVREEVEILRNAFLQLVYAPGDHLTVIVDGHVYRYVTVVTYHNEDGSKFNACTGENA